MTDLKVGDTVWLFDGNRRVYDKETRDWPIFREHFQPVQIVGETSRSWILAYDGRKVDKRTLTTRAEFGIGSRVYASKQDIDDACFVNDHRYEIARAVQGCRDAGTLRHIQELLSKPIGSRP